MNLDPPPIFKSGCWFVLMLSCKNSLQFGDINSLLDISFANTFSHSIGCLSFHFISIGCLFISFHSFFPIQKLFILILSHLLIFAIIFLAEKIDSKKVLLRPLSKSILCMFYSISFIVLKSFKISTHFELIFVYDVIVLHVADQFSQYQFIGKALFSSLNILASFAVDSLSI